MDNSSIALREIAFREAKFRPEPPAFASWW